VQRPILMKKGRPGYLVTVIALPADSPALARLMAEELGTLGIRCLPAVHRFVADRTTGTVEVTIDGHKKSIPVKYGLWMGADTPQSPSSMRQTPGQRSSVCPSAKSSAPYTRPLVKPARSGHETERLTSGNPALDKLLGGGFEPRTLTQLYGGPATGKSTFCMVAAVSCLRAGGSVVFIDSEGFSIERFRQVAGADADAIADRLYLFEPVDFEQQGSMITEADKVLKLHAPALFILDSATALYRTDLEKGQYAMQQLTRQMLQLLGYAKRYELSGARHKPGVYGHHEKHVCRPSAALRSNTFQKRSSASTGSKAPAGERQRSQSTAPGPKARASSTRLYRTGSGQRRRARFPDMPGRYGYINIWVSQ